MKDENSIKSIKWMVHPGRIKTLVHKVDGLPKENENSIKSIWWTDNP